LPEEISEGVKAATKVITTPLSIHAHNDCGLAIANTLAAVKAGVIQVQGTINGYGERCGNADLCSVLPNLKLKMGINCLGDENLAKLTEVSRYISEVANLPTIHHYPMLVPAPSVIKEDSMPRVLLNGRPAINTLTRPWSVIVPR